MKKGEEDRNKSDLIEAVSKQGNITVKDAVNIVNMIFDGFTETIKNGGRIEIRGFGAFPPGNMKLTPEETRKPAWAWQ